MAIEWRVSILPSAGNELEQLPEPVRQEAIKVIADLRRDDPFPYGSIPLRGHTSLYRVKFHRDRYRIIYHVSEKQHRVIITRVRPRRTAYKGL
jgi:mRNA-degrading endonuclease RelE of RelBE toxin-antitoxin system